MPSHKILCCASIATMSDTFDRSAGSVRKLVMQDHLCALAHDSLANGIGISLSIR
jgi:hypothetical protein